jgi:hypothetical protein
VFCSSQDHLRTGTSDLDHPVFSGAENTDTTISTRVDLTAIVNQVEVAEILLSKLLPQGAWFSNFDFVPSGRPGYVKGYDPIRHPNTLAI